jgi:hypothetical protein
MPCRKTIFSKQNDAAVISSRKKREQPGYVMVIGLHAEQPRNRVSIPKEGRDSSSVQIGSWVNAANGAVGSFPEDKVSLPHHSCPSTTITLNEAVGTAYLGTATTVGAREADVRISSPQLPDRIYGSPSILFSGV